jgi:hypothetical protein
MTTISTIASGVCEARFEAIHAEFGATLAARIIESEAADFLWEARVKERYLGQHFDVGLGFGEDEIELSRVAFLSLLGGRWHAGTCIVDGEGLAVDLLWRRTFESKDEAEAGFERAA